MNVYDKIIESYNIASNNLSLDSKRLREVDNNIVLSSKVDIKLIISLNDVIHHFLPSIGIKIDVSH